MATGMLQSRTYAFVVAPQITKTAVRIRIDGAEKLQVEELLSKSKEHVHDTYAIHKMRSTDTEMFVQSASQRDTVLKMLQTEEFKIVR